MSTPVFDIVQNDLTLINWQRCRMVMEVNPNYLYYTVLNENRAVVALKYYQLAYNSNQEMVNILEETIHTDLVLKEKMFSYSIILNWPENCLVPKCYFDAHQSKELLELIHGNLDNTRVLSEKIESSDIYVIYRIPSVLDDFLQQQFSPRTYRHYYSLWLDCVKDPGASPDLVSLIFNPNEMIAVVFSGSQLQVIQNLLYETPEDVAWQLLTIYNRFHLSQEETPMLVGGMIDENSATYEEIIKYFSVVTLEKQPEEITLDEQFQSFPEHFFSPLLRLSLCVS